MAARSGRAGPPGATPGGQGETVDAAVHRGARYLGRRGVTGALHDSRLLLAHALGGEPSRLAARLREPVAPAALRRFGRLLCARGARRPLQHLLGTWEFFGLEVEVGPEALVPRPETELLVEEVLARAAPDAGLGVEVGAGTGCVSIAIAAARPGLRLIATDVSPDALGLARRNAARHGLAGRIELVEGFDLDPLAGRAAPGTLDLVVANPPYLAAGELDGLEPEVRDHDPRVALVAGPTGLEAYRRLVPAAARWIRPGGLVAFEVGCGQAPPVVELLRASGAFAEPAVARDLAGIERVVSATRLPGPVTGRG